METESPQRGVEPSDTGSRDSKGKTLNKVTPAEVTPAPSEEEAIQPV